MDINRLISGLITIAGLILLLYVIAQIISSLQGHSLESIETGIIILVSLILLVIGQLFAVVFKLSSLDKSVSLGFEKMTNKIIQKLDELKPSR